MDIISSSNAIAGSIYKKQNDILYYFRLKKLNDSLLRENTRLRNALGRQSFVDTFQKTIAAIPVAEHKDTAAAIPAKPQDSLIHTVGPPKVIQYALYEYIPARVIKNSVSNDRINFITLNRGKDAGIQKGMAVVTGNGIVGRVANVSEHYATVASVLSYRRISARLRDGTYYNFFFWNPGSPDLVEMTNIPLTTAVKRGDSVFTTGYSYFPDNILIGVISRIDSLRNSNSKSLTIRLSTNFRSLQYVYVVKNKMGTEKRKLEAQTEQKNQ